MQFIAVVSVCFFLHLRLANIYRLLASGVFSSAADSALLLLFPDDERCKQFQARENLRFKQLDCNSGSPHKNLSKLIFSLALMFKFWIKNSVIYYIQGATKCVLIWVFRMVLIHPCQQCIFLHVLNFQKWLHWTNIR